jgi:hypothetical protein
MMETDLFFPNAADASRAITPEGVRRTPIYNRLYYLLTHGQVEGAYRTNGFWRVPVSGLRRLGYNPDTSLALQLPTNQTPSKNQSRQVKVAPISEPKDPLPKSDVSVEMLFHLEQENRELRLKLKHAQEKEECALRRADTAEQHLSDLRSVLDYATTPQKENS